MTDTIDTRIQDGARERCADGAAELDATRQGKRPYSHHIAVRLTPGQVTILRNFAHGTKAARVEDVRRVLREVLG